MPARARPLPDSIAAAPVSGSLLLQNGRWAEARSFFDAELRTHPSTDALRGLGEALWWLGDVEASTACFRRAYAAYLREGNRPAAAETALALSDTYKSCFGNDPVAFGWLSRAERAASGDGIERIHGYLWLQRAHLCARTDIGTAMRLTRDALELARTTGDRDLELRAIGGTGVGLVIMGKVEEGLRCIDEAMAGVSGGEHTRPVTVVVVSCQMLQACEFAGDWERATRWRPVAEEFVDSFGCPFLFTECRTIHGSVLVASGDWTEAEHELMAAARMTEDVYPLVHNEALGQLASLRLRQGRLDEAEALLSSIEDPAYAAIPMAVLHMARGRASAARAMLKRCLRHLPPESLLTARALALLVESSLMLDNLAEARECLSRLEAMSNGELSPEVSAQTELTAGRIAAHEGDIERAQVHLEAATSAFAHLRMPFESACARLLLARTVSAEEPDLAIAEVQSALGVFEKLGARYHADMSAALLRTLGVAPRPGPRGAGVLTQREQEVLDLIGAGLSNPEIAQRLYISRKTAAHHVSAILEKLSLRNRAEAAAYAIRASH